MRIESVCVLGGGGFVGRHLCHQLAARSCRVRVPSRDSERVKELNLLPTVEVVTADVHAPATLRAVIDGMDAVVNLVGVLHDGRGTRSFAAAHVDLARKTVAACRETGVRRYVHMSALAAAVDGPSAYLRSKGEAEAIVRGSGLDATIFRPSVIFGRDDSFLNLFAGLLRVLPVLFLGCPNARFQPVFVEDVVAAFIAALEQPESAGHSYDLCGPRVYTLRELIEYVGSATGCARPVIGLNDRLSYLQAWAMECMPVKLMTRDNYYSMQVDSVCACAFPFDIRPLALEAAAPAWLTQSSPRSRYQGYRDRAGR